MSNSYKIAVFISGTGSNLSAILQQQNNYNYQVALVISNNEKAKGLQYAKQAEIPVYTFKWKKNDLLMLDVQEQLKKFNCKLIVLAGFMRILPAGFIQEFSNKIINIHPSLLPKYPGLNTHQRVIDNKDKWHGATVHYVTEQLDAGKIIAQTKIAVTKGADAKTLAVTLLFREHTLYPYTIGLIAQNRVEWKEERLYFDHKLLTTPIILHD